MYVTSDGLEVACLTDLGDGEFEMRLSPAVSGNGARTPRTIRLYEPTARQYARLRRQMVVVDREIREKFKRPDLPDGIDDLPDAEKQQVLVDYSERLGEWSAERNDYLRGEETAPYANVMIEVVKELNGLTVTLDDLTPEAFKTTTCQALLEAWDAPLGGPGVQPATTPAWAIPAPAAPTADQDGVVPAEPDSPASTPSSPPGTEPSPPSLPAP